MPEKKTVQRARKDKREGKSATTQAGQFVREEIEHVRQGKHGARSAKQAIAIGLSKARRAGVAMPPPKKGQTSERTRKKAERDVQRGREKSSIGASSGKKTAPKRSQARKKALKREGRQAASRQALSRQARQAAAQRRKRRTAAKGR